MSELCIQSSDVRLTTSRPTMLVPETRCVIDDETIRSCSSLTCLTIPFSHSLGEVNDRSFSEN